MGGLGNSAVSDFRKGAESESDRYSRECLDALRDDLVTLFNQAAEEQLTAKAQMPAPGSPNGQSSTSHQ